MPRERELQSIRIKKVFENPKLRQRLSDIQTERYKDPQEREKTSIATRKVLDTPAARNKRSKESKKAWYQNEERKKKASVRMKQIWAERKANNN